MSTNNDSYPLDFVDQTNLDSAFTAVASAIRGKTGGSASIELTIPQPTAFVGAVESIPVTIQPQLYAPTILKTGSHLDVLGNVDNGAFANGAVSIYSGATKVGEASGSPLGYDLNTLSVGNHSITATVSGTNCLESEKSTAISMTVYSITKNFTHLTENSVPSYTAKVASGGTMEIRVTAATDYELSQSSGYSVTNATVNSWVVTDSISGGTSNYGVLTISNPTGAVTITITPTLIPQLDTPTISLSSNILTIEDVPNAKSYDIYDGNTFIANVPVGGVPSGYSGNIVSYNTGSNGGETYIKFDVAPSSSEDYDSAVDYYGNITGDTTYQNKTKAYIWGEGLACGVIINGQETSCRETSYSSAVEITLSGNYDIGLMYHMGSN